MKSIFAVFAFAISVIASLSPASAQYNPHGSVGTGGSMAHQNRVPHAQTVYEDQCRRIGAYNHTMCMTGRRNGGGYGQRPVGRPHYNGRPDHGRQRIVYREAGAYQHGLIRKFGGSTQMRAGAAPVPTPEQIAARVTHKKTRVAVPCIAGYVKNEANGQCDMVSWVAGPEPE